MSIRNKQAKWKLWNRRLALHVGPKDQEELKILRCWHGFSRHRPACPFPPIRRPRLEPCGWWTSTQQVLLHLGRLRRNHQPPPPPPPPPLLLHPNATAAAARSSVSKRGPHASSEGGVGRMMNPGRRPRLISKNGRSIYQRAEQNPSTLVIVLFFFFVCGGWRAAAHLGQSGGRWWDGASSQDLVFAFCGSSMAIKRDYALGATTLYAVLLLPPAQPPSPLSLRQLAFSFWCSHFKDWIA